MARPVRSNQWVQLVRASPWVLWAVASAVTGAPTRLRNGARAAGQVDQGCRTAVPSNAVTITPLWAMLTRKWWKSSSSSPSTSSGDTVTSSILRRYPAVLLTPPMVARR